MDSKQLHIFMVKKILWILKSLCVMETSTLSSAKLISCPFVSKNYIHVHLVAMVTWLPQVAMVTLVTCGHEEGDPESP